MATDPKTKLIESAILVFSEKGYTGAKIAAVAEGAGANIAAVNYHFGSKLKLFIIALRQAFSDANDSYPSQGDLAADSSPEDFIRTNALAVLQRSMDDGKAGRFNKIMNRTMHTAGSPIEATLAEVRQLELEHLCSKIALYLETEDPVAISTATTNFIMLAAMINKIPNGIQGIFDSASPSTEDITAFIENQITLIIATLSTYKSLIQKQASLTA